MTLAESIRNALAFDSQLKTTAMSTYQLGYCDGVNTERARTKELEDALVELVEAADHHLELCEYHGHSFDVVEDALARLEAALAKHEGEK